MSCTRTEEILETPNSTLWPGCSSTAAKSLKVPSDDDLPNGVFIADEEEDVPSAAARGLLDAGQIFDEQEQGGQASGRTVSKC
jgi:hypothetical protein